MTLTQRQIEKAEEIIDANISIYIGPDAIEKQKQQAWYKDLSKRIAQTLTEAEAYGREQQREIDAKICEQLWKNAPNDKESGYEQNTISHGCIRSAEAIRKGEK